MINRETMYQRQHYVAMFSNEPVVARAQIINKCVRYKWTNLENKRIPHETPRHVNGGARLAYPRAYPRAVNGDEATLAVNGESWRPAPLIQPSCNSTKYM